MRKALLVSASSLIALSGVFVMTGAGMEPPAATPPAKVVPAKDEKKAEKPAVTLKVGDKAPAIKVDKWVKGEEVKSFESGKVYVVEFWATWCPPCRTAIPHNTKIAKEHAKHVTVIGVAASERKDKDGSDKRLEKLESFVKEQGDKMGYTVAFDGDRDMSKDWMQAAGQNGIPAAFVIGGDGKIAWIGNPHDDDFEAQVKKAVEKAKKA
ncbi:MAG: TlpA family protein disulfide reductase [Phycisphaerales bacterium]|nr:TlpA family protein disulfide reductase [Phycisphaerales bacterium]